MKSEKYIEDTKARLKWYALEASEEEYNVEEVEALVNLLNTLEPPKEKTVEEKEADLERFRAYCSACMQEEGNTNAEVKSAEYTVEKDKRTEPTNKGKERKSVSMFMRSHKLITAAAAFLLVILVAIGSFGAVNAERNGGFFFWLSQDEGGMTMITSQENLGGEMGTITEEKYDSIEEVPEQYLKYIVEKDELASLDGYEFETVWIQKNDSFCVIRLLFVDKKGEEIGLGVKIYLNKVFLRRESYIVKDNINTKEEVEEGKLYITEVPSVDGEHVVSFFEGSKKFFVEGNGDIETVKKIAEEYQQNTLLFYNK